VVDFSVLNNISTLELNNSLFNDSTNTVVNVVNNADEVTRGYLGLGVMIVIFIVLIVFIFRDDGDIKLDILRSMMLSSGFTFIIGFILTLFNIFSSFTHVIWFFVIFLISIISILVLKKKGL